MSAGADDGADVLPVLGRPLHDQLRLRHLQHGHRLASAPRPHDLFGGASATDGTYLYVFGGYSFTSAQTLNTVYRYNPANDTWSTLAPMPTGTLVSSAIYYQPTNTIYVFGGAERDLQIV